MADSTRSRMSALPAVPSSAGLYRARRSPSAQRPTATRQEHARPTRIHLRHCVFPDSRNGDPLEIAEQTDAWWNRTMAAAISGSCLNYATVLAAHQ